MTMGERIRQARLDAGLSQRQLAGDVMTRNMLSALEHDGANPSVGTLRYLSEKLCKPISYFLGEDVLQLSQTQQMEEIRIAFRKRDFRFCLERLETLEAEEFAAERGLIKALSALELADQALGQGKRPYANQLLRQSMDAGQDNPYLGKDFERRWLVLAARAETKTSRRAVLVGRIPGDDEVLCMKAEAALEDGNADRAEQLLSAVEQQDENWYWLRGEVWFARKEYDRAIEYYRKVENVRPESIKRLEICYRELEDYKMAYYYATRKT